MIRRTIIGIVSCFSIFLLSNGTASANTNYDKLLPVAKKYIGVPYKYAGTDERGFDCSGYIQTVYRSLGVNMPRTTKDLAKTGTSIDRNNLRTGDIVLFDTLGSGVSHAGIYIGNERFIHSATSSGISISGLNDNYWKGRYLGARRVLSYDLNIGQFHDVDESHWAYPIVNKLAKEDLVLGYENSYFMPQDNITRAEVAAMLAEAFSLKMNNRSGNFPDVSSNHWAVGVVNAVFEKGIFKGNGANQFKPSDSLTRGQMAAIISRAYNLKAPASPKTFTDVDSSHWAYEDVQKLAASGITTGYNDGSFKPEEFVTRSQFAAFLYRAQF
ncbi:S-layer homology domain-containing protein [Bacillus sp. FJAT-29790]|uniref:C40 family peptidase n=1 Tax=Bacillus sp. FJAT-29790 TaxID=1895002 RepID=UPI001C22C8C1|nr:S-layer homology domain-containing protein [Bacillus sp. FJAT-29790]MBU8881109.1 S-layer homology domain-containing protein [Bacillus sp. FJAT-29790]